MTMPLDAMFWWAPCWVDTQIGGALIQVVAAGLVAWAVNRKGNKDRAAALTLEYNREWNTPDMVMGRTLIARRLFHKQSHPEIIDDDFPQIWQVMVFYRRLAALRRSRNFDPILYEDIMQTDAGNYSVEVRAAWGLWGVYESEYNILAPKGPSHYLYGEPK